MGPEQISAESLAATPFVAVDKDLYKFSVLGMPDLALSPFLTFGGQETAIP
jgi:hypothetical protein